MASVASRIVISRAVAAGRRQLPQTLPRRWASQPALVEEAAAGSKSIAPVAEAASAPAVAPAKTVEAAAAVKEKVKLHPSSSVWQRFVAFLTGVGVSSVWYYYTISTDVWTSTDAIEKALQEFKTDVAKSNRDLRQKVAVLEHEIAALKK